jgi:hypothetical protein
MAPDKEDMDATADAAERLEPLMEKAAASLEAELRARPTPALTDKQWKAFDATDRTSPRASAASALVAAGLIQRAGIWYSKTAWGVEVARRRREGAPQ